MTRIAFHPATVPLRILSPANDTVEAGRYKATTLSAVDADLAAANIAEAITIFGFLGTFVGGALAEDVLGEAGTTLTGTDSGGFRLLQDLAEATALTIATTDLNFDASSMAVGVGYIGGEGVGEMKLQLVMGGVQVAESAEIDGRDNWIVVATRALSGVQTCLVRIHNYGTINQIRLMGFLSGDLVAGGVAAGSIKI
ncbi:MAG TPA: hypothetical protein VMW64_08230 [Dehalococcoidia bacterium]|nr:hypothetical protein [Dehalococcoidia bacterium]